MWQPPANQPGAPPQQPNAWGQWQPPNPYVQGAGYGQQPGVWQPAGPMYGAPSFEVSTAQSKAKTAMVCGLVGLLCFGIILGPVALITGVKAKTALQRLAVEEGQGMATAGIVLGSIDIVLALFWIVAMIANH
jgi:hypothetical protein